MNLSQYSHLIKYVFIGLAIIIATSFLIISKNLVDILSQEERQKIELWAEATRQLAQDNEEDMADLNTDLILQILSSNTTIPVILSDKENNIILHANLNLKTDSDPILQQEKLEELKGKHAPIVIDNDSFKQYVYYDDSYTLKQLQLYPYIQIGVLTIFILTSFLALLSTKKAEQNKVWVGLSKETAHQLGTPISSLMAWTEYMKMKEIDPSITQEIEKDVTRLEMVAERFSKIGSAPSYTLLDLKEVVTGAVAYLENRISKKVKFTFIYPPSEVYTQINNSLFSWVIENVTKNAVDAMEGQGEISFTIRQNSSTIYLDITDTGKGISKSRFKTIFSPGYTTKSRGWGLGLSLTKRIVETYHNGKIFIKWSEIGVGTTFRIELKKQEAPLKK